jgi:hypothetical protein
MDQVGSAPQKVTTLIAQQIKQFLFIRLWIEVAISVDDPLRREVQKKTDQWMNSGVEGLGVPVCFGTEASGPDGSDEVVLSQGGGLN